jgi:hypothetical protein
MQASFNCNLPVLPSEQRARPLPMKVKLSSDSLRFLRSWADQVRKIKAQQCAPGLLGCSVVRVLLLGGQ